MIISLGFFQFGYAQEKPVTQTEYVKMLYALQKNPGGATAIVDALRRRGINFPLTDGLRGLTRSKSSNNEELKRTIEEAERRRQDPTASKPPEALEAKELLDKTRKNTLEAVEEMPDFVVKQLVSRSSSFAGTGNWKSRDNIAIAVSYSEKEGEQYKVLAINGAQVNAERGRNYAGLNGSTTSGEFVETLKRIFAKESKTEFTVLTTDSIRGRRTFVFEYRIDIENNKERGLIYQRYLATVVATGEKGRVWIDVEKSRVLRIDNELTDIPATFQITAFQSSIDYDWVTIADQTYLLPVLSDARFTIKREGFSEQSRNLVRFKNYQKFGTEVKVVEEDSEPVPEEKP